MPARTKTDDTEPESDLFGVKPGQLERPAKNVIEALARVIRDLGGIPKMTPQQRKAAGLGGSDDERGIKYAYRGIDQIATALQPLLAKHGVIICPIDTVVEVTNVVVNNNPWTDTAIHIRWVIAGPGDTTIHAMSSGQGRDNSDKGINKATTSAYKNLLLRLLCIGDPDDDPDNARHESEPERVPEVNPADALFERVKALAGTTVATELQESATENSRKLTANAFRADPKWAELVDRIITAAEASPPPPATPTEDEVANQAGVE